MQILGFRGPKSKIEENSFVEGHMENREPVSYYSFPIPLRVGG